MLTTELDQKCQVEAALDAVEQRYLQLLPVATKLSYAVENHPESGYEVDDILSTGLDFEYDRKSAEEVIPELSRELDEMWREALTAVNRANKRYSKISVDKSDEANEQNNNDLSPRTGHFLTERKRETNNFQKQVNEAVRDLLSEASKLR